MQANQPQLLTVTICCCCALCSTGKSTYCNALSKYCEQTGRTVHVVNLDPAAEHFEYPVAIDIRDLISLSDVIEELNYGPNGGLVYCMESVARTPKCAIAASDCERDWSLTRAAWGLVVVQVPDGEHLMAG